MTQYSDKTECSELLRNGSRSFFAASLLLPKNIRRPATALYAFCRVADDLVDSQETTAGSLEQLRLRLDDIYDGKSVAQPADRAFSKVVARFKIPRELPEALFEGFQWDVQGQRYETLSDLNAYGVRVAGTVGVMMAMIMGQRDTRVLARACDLGVAMQLTNIARDVGEDARNGRLYLPRKWLTEAGIDADAWLVRPVFSEALASVTRRLLSAAEELYQRADSGIQDLPSGCRPGIRAARLIYSDIGRSLERQDLNSVASRAIVTQQRKLKLVLRAFTSRSTVSSSAPAPALDEAMFLLNAVANTPAPFETEQGPRNIEDKLIWVTELFARLERRDRLLHGAPIASGLGTGSGR